MRHYIRTRQNLKEQSSLVLEHQISKNSKNYILQLFSIGRNYLVRVQEIKGEIQFNFYVSKSKVGDIRNTAHLKEFISRIKFFNNQFQYIEPQENKSQ